MKRPCQTPWTKLPQWISLFKQPLQIRKRKSSTYYLQPQGQLQNRNRTSTPTLEIINYSKEINWPKNRIQQYNHYTQQQQSQPLPKQREKHPQQLHYSSINPNSSTEQFAAIDGNERHERTFTFITDLINSFTQPTCIYPCTLDAYQKGRCCETVVIASQPPSNVCCQHPLPPSPPVLRPPLPTIVLPPSVIPPPPLQPLPMPAFPFIPTQCCNSCSAYVYYGPPCIRYTIPGRVTLYMG